MTINNTTTNICRARKEYSDSYDAMKWLTPETATAASLKREHLIKTIFNNNVTGPGWKFSQTKLFTHDISPGCALCGQGDWSCLFINGICNARCFYCPSEQKKKGQPVTSTLEFSNPTDYAKYVNLFNIKGVSFSGGEPLMTFDRVLLFLKTLRSKVTHPLYIWMYTNGLLVTEDKLKALRDNGLDEIRFDISANKYQLDALKKAIGIIPCVTVEIPAIPEDIEKTKLLIKELYEAGVNYFNLHQIRCTQFNKNQMIQRCYTFVNGAGLTIMETEITALELIQYSLDNNISLPINYCSFTYRHQYQRAGAQRRNALQIKADHEDVTTTGRIRTLSVCGTEKQIASIHRHLLSKEDNKSLWSLPKDGDQLFFNATLWPLIDFSNVQLKVSYSGTSLKSAVTYRHRFKELALNKKKKVVIERYFQQPGVFLEAEQIQEFGQEIIKSNSHFPLNSSNTIPQDLLNEIKAFESFSPGLAKIY
jgi:pyruvate formate-lyase activating enzyme-like uncharacterized protein